MLYTGVVVLVALFTINVGLAAFNAPWYVQPLAVLRYVLDDLGSMAAEALGHLLGVVLTTLFDRFSPAFFSSLHDLVTVSISGWHMTVELWDAFTVTLADWGKADKLFAWAATPLAKEAFFWPAISLFVYVCLEAIKALAGYTQVPDEPRGASNSGRTDRRKSVSG